MEWTIPKKFEHTHVINGAVWNKYTQANLRHLFERPRNIARVSSVYSTTSTEYVPIDQTALRVSLDLVADETDVMLWFNMNLTTTTAGTYQYHDMFINVLQDGEDWITGDEDRPMAIVGNRFTSVWSNAHAKIVIPKLEAGRHYWVMYWKGESGEAIATSADLLSYMGVMEI